MKQFQKYGVAAAVASVAAGAVAQEVSNVEAGDLALVPYYSVLDGKNTGIHIINTTDSTQVVKVRLRRGADSKDALDFNVVMSPRDEWTANIGAGGDTGVQVTTGDNSCTVPAFDNGVAQMPDTYAEGATEGYVEIIAMGQTATETSHLAIGAKHGETGVPESCDIVRQNFFRVAAGNVGDASVRGAHTSDLASSGVCTSANSGILPGTTSTAAATALCAGGVSDNLSSVADADDNALKVSYFLTDAIGGLEAGDNAVMVSGFAAAPMMTNQQPLSFGTAGVLQFDPLNFELPNLAYGAYESSVTARRDAGADGASDISSGVLFDGVRNALDADALINDWASFEAADGSTVAADWVVTLPGQYTLTNPICELYDAYTLAATAALCTTGTAGTRTAAAAQGGDELPLVLSSSTTSNPLSGTTNLSLWDREEGAQVPPETPGSDDLGFSPGGSAGDPTQLAVLDREVNVISWNDNSSLNTAASQEEDLGLGVNVNVPNADRGWGQLAIVPADAAVATIDFGGLVNDDDDLTSDDGSAAGENAVADPDHTAAIGISVWERHFADQAGGNYGRAIEHSTISSSGRM